MTQNDTIYELKMTVSIELDMKMKNNFQPIRSDLKSTTNLSV